VTMADLHTDGEFALGGEPTRRFRTEAAREEFIVSRTPPCRCCGIRCPSQWEFVPLGDDPYIYCAGCDPQLHEPGGYRCPCSATHTHYQPDQPAFEVVLARHSPDPRDGVALSERVGRWPV